MRCSWTCLDVVPLDLVVGDALAAMLAARLDDAIGHQHFGFRWRRWLSDGFGLAGLLIQQEFNETRRPIVAVDAVVRRACQPRSAADAALQSLAFIQFERVLTQLVAIIGFGGIVRMQRWQWWCWWPFQHEL